MRTHIWFVIVRTKVSYFYIRVKYVPHSCSVIVIQDNTRTSFLLQDDNLNKNLCFFPIVKHTVNNALKQKKNINLK